MTRPYLLTTNDADRWRAVLPANLGVFGSVEYVRAAEKHTGWPARLFVFESPAGGFAYPFFLRSIRELPFTRFLKAECWDTVTPEYTGPLKIAAGTLAGPKDVRFVDAFAEHCRENHIVAEFAHLNPWQESDGRLDPVCIESNREIVYVDLTLSEEQIWQDSLASDCRRKIRQSERANVRIRRAETPDDVREFHRIYSETMQRRQAQERYHFSAEYFLEFFHQLPENAFYMLAEYQDRVIAGGLFFEDQTNVYWHLSAVDIEFAQVGPVNAYMFETIRRVLGRGKQRMLLGGGYQTNDGVFRFKTNFSPLRAQFCTYKRVHDAETYSALTRAWSDSQGGQQPRTEFFPAYRSARPEENS